MENDIVKHTINKSMHIYIIIKKYASNAHVGKERKQQQQKQTEKKEHTIELRLTY